MRSNPSQIALIGYSGHAYVVFDIFFSQGIMVSAYCEEIEKKENPFMLTYLGSESEKSTIEKLQSYGYFVCLGDNLLRRKVSEELIKAVGQPENALHKTAILSRSINCGTGIMFGPRCVVNAKTEMGNGVICNTGSIIEHECKIGDYAHIAPGAVLCGNVTVGENSLIGAAAVILPGVTIGKNVIIGAGAVINKNVPDGIKIVGNPGRNL